MPNCRCTSACGVQVERLKTRAAYLDEDVAAKATHAPQPELVMLTDHRYLRREEFDRTRLAVIPGKDNRLRPLGERQGRIHRLHSRCHLGPAMHVGPVSWQCAVIAVRFGCRRVARDMERPLEPSPVHREAVLG